MILVTHKEKPLPRAGKGTLMRKAALKEYHSEIETLSVLLLLAHTRLTPITSGMQV